MYYFECSGVTACECYACLAGVCHLSEESAYVCASLVTHLCSAEQHCLRAGARYAVAEVDILAVAHTLVEASHSLEYGAGDAHVKTARVELVRGEVMA